jgi:glycosyltransferase involved in cell wall biosynthesis
MKRVNPAPLSVVILTLNEEKNIAAAVKSVIGWSEGVFVVDSGSSDDTVKLAEALGARVSYHPFTGYSDQRNWALKNLPYPSPWAFFVDADERPSRKLKEEITRLLNSGTDCDGFFIKRKFIFLSRFIKHGGYYPVWLLRLFKHKKAVCDSRRVNEHFLVSGKLRRIERGDLIHQDRRDISFWIEKHNRYSSLEAEERTFGTKEKSNASDKSYRKRRFLRDKLYPSLPPFFRAFALFFYRYFIRLGFLDGKEGLIYHFLHGLWYPFLIDAKIYELKRRKNEAGGSKFQNW